MTDCAEARARLGAHVLGGLEPDETSELLGHLAVCADCSQARARLAPLVSLIDLAGPARQPALPPGFEERLVARASADAGRRSRVRPGRRAARTRVLLSSVASALAGAAVAAAVISAFGDLGGGTREPEQVMTVQLAPTGGRSRAKAVVYVITRDGHTTLALEASGLPRPGQGKQFVVWLSGKKGSYSAGTIRVNGHGWGTAVLDSPRRAPPGSSIEISLVPARSGVKGYRTIVRGTL